MGSLLVAPKGAVCTLLATLVLLGTVGWSHGRRYRGLLDDDEVLEVLLMKRLEPVVQCMNGGAKCFSSTQCCPGFVCAAFDDYFGQNPEIPGFCVKEKDLRLCSNVRDCEGQGAKCLALGRTGQRYCVRSGIEEEVEAIQPDDGGMMREREGRRRLPNNQQADNYIKGHGRLGSPCESSTECKPTTEDGLSELCCQDVSRARQGVKRMCSKVIAISRCI